MAVRSEQINAIVRKLQSAKSLLMREQLIYAVLLEHAPVFLDPLCETVYTDGEKICFCPEFLEKLTVRELEFVLMHEILHITLGHCDGPEEDCDFDEWNTACDIVVNSIILSCFNDDTARITLHDFGECMHLTPLCMEGFLFTEKEVYEMLHGKARLLTDPKIMKKDLGKMVELWHEHIKMHTPRIAERQDGGFDDHTFWGEEENGSYSGTEGKKGDPEAGENKEDHPENGREKSGSEDKQEDGKSGSENKARQNSGNQRNSPGDAPDSGHDNAYHQNRRKEKWERKAEWKQHLIEAEQAVKQREAVSQVPASLERIISEIRKPQTDWRQILDNFLQEEVNDYSFDPPDRRFQDSDFLLPDFNVKDETPKDILFMVDTSGSMSSTMITQAYSEIKGAIDQFNGRLSGWIGFFDAAVTKPEPFRDEQELKTVRPRGGGGTSFACIFDYVRKHAGADFDPVSIIIFTDGYAPFPEERAAMGIPVLWLINNDHVTPPWGKTARLRPEKEEQETLQIPVQNRMKRIKSRGDEKGHEKGHVSSRKKRWPETSGADRSRTPRKPRKSNDNTLWKSGKSLYFD